MTPAFPELLSTIDAVLGAPAIVDGEIVVPDENGMPDPEALRARVRPEHGARRPRRRPATLLANDLPYRMGRPFLREPLSRRRRALAEALTPGEHLVIVPTVTADGVTLFDAVEAQGLPAVLARRADGPYLPGVRSDLWRRIATRRHFEAVVGGYDPRPDGSVALLLGAWEKHHGADDRLAAIAAIVAPAGSSLAPALERTLRRREDPVTPFGRGVRAGYRWVRPDLVVALQHHGWRDGRLADPTLVAIRDDLDARACWLPPAALPGDANLEAPPPERSGGRPVLALLQRLPLDD